MMNRFQTLLSITTCATTKRFSELHELWDESEPVTAWEGITFGEAGGADEGRVVGPCGYRSPHHPLLAL